MGRPTPQIILGQAASGEGADVVRTGFAKYNAHTHQSAQSTFNQFPFSVGDTVEAYPDEQEDINTNAFPQSTVINEIRDDQLIVSSFSTEAITESHIFMIAGQRYQGFTCPVDSSVISLPKRSGSVSPNLLGSLVKNVVSGSVLNPASGHRVNALILPPFNGFVTGVSAVTDRNNCEILVYIDDAAINIAHSVTPSPSALEIIGNLVYNNRFGKSSVVSILILNPTGPLTMDFNIHYSKYSDV